MCASPNKCICDLGWKGEQCDTAVCQDSCGTHGRCKLPDTCTCDLGWQGLTCAIPFSTGFQLRKLYIYNITLSYEIETEFVKNGDEIHGESNMNSTHFFSNVNISFSVTSVRNESDLLFAVLEILHITCDSDVKNNTANVTCDKDSVSSLLHIKQLFSQNMRTGKINSVYYNASTKFQAVLIAQILHFIDCEIPPLTENNEKMSFLNGQEIKILRRLSKSPSGMQCFNFNRIVKSENMTTHNETKRVCIDKTGIPETINMTEVFSVGQGEKIANSFTVKDKNISLLPFVKGFMTASGSLISVKTMKSIDEKEELKYIQDTLTSENVKSAIVDEFVTRKEFPKDDHKESSVYKDIVTIINHPFSNRRLSLGLDLIQKSTSAISVITKILFSNNNLDLESRSLLISLLGASNTMSGQKSLLKILDSEELVENDHYIALGSVAQLSHISEDMVSVVKKVMENTMDDNLKVRSILVLGVMGSKGLLHKILPILTEKLLKKSFSHSEKSALISALGNTHSQSVFDILSKQFAGSETHFKVLSIRALRNIPGQESYNFVIKRLLTTSHRSEAIECIKTLGYKKQWIRQTDLNQMMKTARESKDKYFLDMVRNMCFELHEQCTSTQNCDFHDDDIAFNRRSEYIKASESHIHKIFGNSDNFCVFLNITPEFHIRGSEFDFNANAKLNMKIFGKDINLIKAGTVNSMVNTTMFMSSVFMTLNLLFKEYDLFTRTWKYNLGLGVAAGNPCKANNGFIRKTPLEYKLFWDSTPEFGIPGLASLKVKVKLSGKVSFGYGFNVIGNESDVIPKQINVVAMPQAKILSEVGLEVSSIVVAAGVRGQIDAVSGNIQTNVAFNLNNKQFCHFISTDLVLLNGSVNIFVDIGFWPFEYKRDIQVFSWGGFNFSSILSDTSCCLHDFLIEQNDIALSGNMKSSPLSSLINANTLSFLIETNKCFHSTNIKYCPKKLIQRLEQKGVYVFNVSMSEKLNTDNFVFFRNHIFPILVAGIGQWYGINKLGDVVVVNEIGQLTKLTQSVENILVDLAYAHPQEAYGLSKRRNMQEYALSKQRFYHNVNVETKILDLRPYCKTMQAICENIKIGKKYHSDVMIFTENPGIIQINEKEACSSFIQTYGIKYPYYCESYPFSFSFQGGNGATVRKVNIKERSVKMEAVHAFIHNFGLKGGDSFVVLI